MWFCQALTIPGAIAYFQLRRTVAQGKSEQPALMPGSSRTVPGQAGALQGS